MSFRKILGALTPSVSTRDHMKIAMASEYTAAISQYAGNLFLNSESSITQPLVAGTIFSAIYSYHVNNHNGFFHSNASDTQKAFVALLEYLTSIGLSYTFLTALGSNTLPLSQLLVGGSVGLPLGLTTCVFMSILIKNNLLPLLEAFVEEKPLRLTQ